MQRLQEIVSDIIEDKVITDDEIESLQDWLKKHTNLMGFYPFDKIYESVETIMLDGIMDEDEQQKLFHLLDAFIKEIIKEAYMNIVCNGQNDTTRLFELLTDIKNIDR